MKLFLLFLLAGVGLGVQLQAQDLTGIWRGNFRRTPTAANSKLMELLGGEERYKFEVQIDQRNKQFNGVTYSYLTTVFYGKATCKGTVDPRTKKVMLEELKIVEVRMAAGDGACVMTLWLQYSKADGEEFLEGTYTSVSTNKDSSSCGRGTVFLRKVTTSDFYEEPFLVEREKAKQKAIAQKPVIKKPVNPPTKITPKQPDVAVKKPATTTTQKPATTTPKKTTTTQPPVQKPVAKSPVAKPNVKIVQADTVKKTEVKTQPKLPDNIVVPKVLTNRENELVKTITIPAGEVVVNIYDNGTVDNDTISVYLDKKLVMGKKRLTEKPLTLKLNLDATNNYHELVMVADNLGEIPPNTSLMVVNAGGKQYEVRITSNEQKNAVVIFKLAQ
jgi:hypothetical protein